MISLSSKVHLQTAASRVLQVHFGERSRLGRERHHDDA